uniref:serine/threonine-protein kinase par-1-like n=1 Tax=Myxine glutinosa TaxID=7769 RepID=UPI00358E9A3C
MKRARNGNVNKTIGQPIRENLEPHLFPLLQLFPQPDSKIRDRKHKEPMQSDFHLPYCIFILTLNAEPQETNASVDEELSTDDESTSCDGSFSSADIGEYEVQQVVFTEWEVISKIGEGSGGFVYKVKNVNSSEEVALKKAKSFEASLRLWHEASIMKALNHPNIIKLIDILTKDPFLHRVGFTLEYVEAGSLASKIRFLRNLPEVELCFPMKQMADAFEYLHSRNIVHRDIKVTNSNSVGLDTFCNGHSVERIPSPQLLFCTWHGSRHCEDVVVHETLVV